MNSSLDRQLPSIKLARLKDFEETQKDTLASKVLTRLCKQQANPSYEEYQELQRGILTGDVPMDKVVAWVLENPKKHRKMFETALYKGIEHIDEKAPILEEFFAYIEKKLDWVEPDKFPQALEFMHKLGTNFVFLSRDLSLMTGYLFPGMTQPLIFTGALTKQVTTRLAETSKWWLDLTQKNGLDRFNTGFTSTIYVRFIHSLIRTQLGKSDKWDEQRWGVAANQHDLSLTNIAFAQVILIGVRGLGIFPSKQEIDSFLAFWSYAGWLMGIEEKWIAKTEEQAWRYLFWLQYTNPESDESSKILGYSLSQEPFAREYSNFSKLRAKIIYQQHLGITKFFAGKKGLEKLGVTDTIIPWFPLMLIPQNLVKHIFLEKLDFFKRRLITKGRQQQIEGFALYQPDGNIKLASMHQS